MTTHSTWTALRDLLRSDMQEIAREAGPSLIEARRARNAERRRIDAVWHGRLDVVKAKHTEPAVLAVLDLHRPCDWLDEQEAHCNGCDVAPHSYTPSWPCSTVKLLDGEVD